MSEVLVKVENVSKKFSKDFKKSLWYGVKDMSSALFTNQYNQNVLRPSEFWAVKNVSFELRRGECLGLIGHNGAGKSTLLKVLNGLIRPDEGKITMHGRIGALIELGAGFNPILTGRENIYNNGSVLGFSKKEIDAKLDSIIEFSEIGEYIDSPVRNYSSGMKVKLGFAVASQLEPDVLIIDEVLAVGDAGFRIKCLNRIINLMSKTAVIFVSHSMVQISKISTEIMLLKKGKILLKTQNAGEGIQKYFEEFKSNEEFQTQEGEIRIKKFEIIYPDNLKTINYNEDLHANIQFDNLSNEKCYSLDISFTDKEMKVVAISTITKFEVSENMNYKLVIKHFPITAGKYNVNIAIRKYTNSTRDGEALSLYNNICTLAVSGGDITRYCSVQLKGVLYSSNNN
ncbi:ABC transporter ATP-binding protein [Formosa sp. PL04]|uniref:ABC transporter ATP-binding protein n=1 Tax=Formosa sp. PL04 TaxID=3081755 RepID=UPI002981BC94|nr:ABC transporter ATP-binding protein [Formosa sp. PL04]MDW5287889.1 ABC transporter ATP-binding protein [Formosa sp. PL04]